MSYVDALQMTNRMRDRLVDLAVSQNYIREAAITKALRRTWEKVDSVDSLVSELWVEGTIPCEKSLETLSTLVEKGMLNRDLYSQISSSGAFPIDERLYVHQLEALRNSALPKGEKPVLVITAGTGQGKTESFLLPLLNDLYSAPKRTPGGGMRALILYPMNALVTDQVERIYGWLKGQKHISVFHFTSETPENAREANRGGEPKWQPCRIRTRQEARGRETCEGRIISEGEKWNVPDIVITNYSMLEYMLCRPQDAVFFGPDLRCIVLDEAHLYTGALAAEIAMLLRRVKARCCLASEDILQIATSATLGGTDEELKKYASTLFSVRENNTHTYHGKPGEPDMGATESPPSQEANAEALAPFSGLELRTLTSGGSIIEDAPDNELETLRIIVSNLVSEEAVLQASVSHPSSPARFLHMTLRQAPLIRRLSAFLLYGERRILNVKKLSELLFPTAEEHAARAATVLLLRLSAAARSSTGEMPLVPHRLHLLVRAPEGLSICLNASCSGDAITKIDGLGCIQANRDRCRFCNHLTLPVHRCHYCGEWAMAGHESREFPVLEQAYYSPSASAQTFFLLNHAGVSKSDNVSPGRETIIDSITGKRLGNGASGISLWKAPFLREHPEIQCCPTCLSEWTPRADSETSYVRQTNCVPLIGGQPFALSVVAETVLHGLPPYQDSSQNWKPAQGRRLLCFSDSRRAAARLGPLLTRQHEIGLIRAAIARTAREYTSYEVVDYLSEDIKRLKIRLSGVDSSERLLGERIRSELNEKENELNRALVGIPFEQFARLFAERPEIRHILHRETGEKHRVDTFSQDDWENNTREVQSQAEGLLSSEVDRPIKDQVHVEATGLVEIAYPGVEGLMLPVSLGSEIPSKDIKQQLENAWPSFIHLLLDSLRYDLCIGWANDVVNNGRLWMGRSFLTGRWATRKLGGWRAHPFVGATINQRRRTFAANVLRAAGCNKITAEALSSLVLESAFDQLYSTKTLRSWLETKEHHQVDSSRVDKAIRLKLDNLSIKRPSSIFRCRETGTIWPRSALGWTWIEGCRGRLDCISDRELDDDPRWGRSRRELLESPFFSEGLWGEEHSAQLSPQENQRLQGLFKNGIRNILSSTTTMELGVDIGGLNGVLLGNVPPGPANHRQRAGRAGRRSDGSAIVVTYARHTDYDREVFLHFEKFMTKNLRRPTVFLNRARIVNRHLQAILISEFMRPAQPGRTGTMEAFGRMGVFCGVSEVLGWLSQERNSQTTGTADEFSTFLSRIEEKPEGVDNYLARIAEGTPYAELMHKSKWISFIKAAEERFKMAIEEWRTELNQLKEACDEIPDNPIENRKLENAKTRAIHYQAKLLCDIPVIEWLADHRFMPRYGFPINLQRLTVRSSENNLDAERACSRERYRLERGALLALSEYVPGSRVLVGGRIAHSRGVSKHWTESNKGRALGLDELAITCKQGHVFLSRSLDAICPTCKSSKSSYERLLFPRFGYTTASWEIMEREISFERIGETKPYPVAFAEEDLSEETRNDFGGISGLTVRYREGAKMLIRNAGEISHGFALCTKCGYADSEIAHNQEGIMNLPKDFDIHPSIFSERRTDKCWPHIRDGKTSILRNRVIAASESTDMLMMQWPGATTYNPKQTWSLGRALIMAGTRLLELDHRELGMLVVPLVHPFAGIVIYDTSPGGTGHCAELLEKGAEWIQTTHDVLYVNEEHNRTCTRACLECILDFSGQYAGNLLDRMSALELLGTTGSVQ